MVTSKPNVNMPLFVLSFFMVELKLSYHSSHLKHYKVKQLRKIYKKESKESNCLFSITI